MFNRQKVRWASSVPGLPARRSAYRLRLPPGWTSEGVAHTLDWYRSSGWLCRPGRMIEAAGLRRGGLLVLLGSSRTRSRSGAADADGACIAGLRDQLPAGMLYHLKLYRCLQLRDRAARLLRPTSPRSGEAQSGAGSPGSWSGYGLP